MSKNWRHRPDFIAQGLDEWQELGFIPEKTVAAVEKGSLTKKLA
jgi:hypothetical protein